MSRILYRLIAALALLAVRSGRAKDLEIIVLRHQLTILRRQIDRPELNEQNRSLLGAIAACGCPISCRGWSGGMFVFVEEAIAAGRSDESKG